MTDATAEKPSKEDVKLRNLMAKVMWDVDNKATEFADMKTRQEKFAEVRDEYRKRAVAVVRQLKRRGVEITPPASDSADE